MCVCVLMCLLLLSCVSPVIAGVSVAKLYFGQRTSLRLTVAVVNNLHVCFDDPHTGNHCSPLSCTYNNTHMMNRACAGVWYRFILHLERSPVWNTGWLPKRQWDYHQIAHGRGKWLASVFKGANNQATILCALHNHRDQSQPQHVSQALVWVWKTS